MEAFDWLTAESLLAKALKVEPSNLDVIEMAASVAIELDKTEQAEQVCSTWEYQHFFSSFISDQH